MALARILLLEPEVVILDEPTAGLDLSVQATILNLLQELRQRLSLTLLFISHDLSVVERLADRVAIMLRGRIVESGPTAQIFRSPTDPYTVALLDAAPRLDHARDRGSRALREQLICSRPSWSPSDGTPVPSRRMGR